MAEVSDDPVSAWLAHPWRAARRLGGTIGLALLVLGVALVVIERQAGGDGVWQRLWGPWLVPAWLLLAGAFVANGVRWRDLMPAGVWPPALGLANIQCAGMLLTFAVPGPVGEIGAAWLASRQYAVPLADGLASSLAGRVLGLVTAGLLSVGLWLAFDLPVPDSLQAPVGLVAVGLGLAGAVGLLVAARPDRVRAGVGAALRRLATAPVVGRLAEALDRGLGAFARAIGDVARRGPAAWTRATAWSFVGHAAVACALIATAWSVGSAPSPAGVAFAYATVTAGSVFLYAAPGSQVATDGLMVTLLVVAGGLDLSDAVAVTFLLRVLSVSVLFLGAAGVAWAGRRPAGPVAG